MLGVFEGPQGARGCCSGEQRNEVREAGWVGGRPQSWRVWGPPEGLSILFQAKNLGRLLYSVGQGCGHMYVP